MQAVIYDKKALADKLVIREVKKPAPGPNQVLVHVMAASVNAADYRSMKMGMIPKHRIFGSAIAGRVVSIGEDIQQFRPGDAVLGDLADVGFGGLAEYVAVPEGILAHKPEKVSFEAAATLPVSATTALQALRNKGQIQAGQKVLLLGSSGGVGTFAVQLAKHFGAEVTAVCSTQHLSQSTSIGADFVLDYTQEDITKSKKQYDLIIAINGHYPLLAGRRLLTKNGRYVVVGGTLSQIFKALLFGRFLSWGSKTIRTLSATSNQQDLREVAQLVAEEKIRPVIEHRYPFAEAPEALRYLATGHAKGKVVIHLDGS